MKMISSTNVRVLHVINGTHYSGGERVQDILGLTLPDFGYEVGYACLKPDLFPRVYRARSSPIYSLPMRHRADISPLKALREVIRTEGYRIVHSHMPRTAPLSRLACAFEHVPMVHHIHCPTLFDSPNPILNLVSATVERISLINVSKVIPCSQGMKDYVRSIGISKKRIAVVLNGIPAYGPLVPRPEPQGEWVFGIVALFRPRKGLEYLLNAMRIVKNKGFHFRLRAIGDFMAEEYRTKIRELVGQLGLSAFIDWVGFRRDIPAELKKLDFFVLPSTGGEGLPIAILEAMAAGLPVVTTGIAGSREVIRDGMDGYLCKPGSVASLAACLERMMADPSSWSRLRASAHARQREQFSDISMASGVARVYDSVLKRAAN